MRRDESRRWERREKSEERRGEETVEEPEAECMCGMSRVCFSSHAFTS